MNTVRENGMGMVTDRIRSFIGEALASERLDGLGPLRTVRELLGTANDLVGRPFFTNAELAAKQAMMAPAAPTSPEPAPVVVYFDGKDHRTKVKVEEILLARGIAFRVLDVSEDEATRSFATTSAKASEFPLIFIAGTAVGGLHELMQLEVNGELARRVFGA